MFVVLRVVICLLLCQFHVYAQTNVDSLRKVALSEEDEVSNRQAALYQLGMYYLPVHPDSSRLFAEQQLALARTEGDVGSEGRALLVMGTHAIMMGKRQEAIQFSYEGLPLSIASGDSAVVGRFLNLMAGVYTEMGQLDSATAYHQQSLDWNGAIGEKKWVFSAINGLGLIAQKQGKWEEALALYERGVDMLEELDFPVGKANLYTNIAYLYVIRSEYERAIEYTLESYSLFEEVGDLGRMTATLDKLGLLHYYDEQYDKALRYFAEGVDLSEQLDNERAKANLYGNMGMVYVRAGRIDSAMSLYERSLKIKESLNDKEGLQDNLANIGILFMDQGEYEPALIYFQRSLSLSREMKDQRRVAVTLAKIGQVYQLQGENSVAQDYASQSLELSKQLQLPDLESPARLTLASTYQETGQPQQARLELNRVVEIGEQLGDASTLANAYAGLARLAAEGQRWEKARTYGKQALGYAQQIQAVDQISEAANLLWQSQEALGQKAAAFDTYRLYVQMRDSLNSEENQRATIRFEYQQQAIADSLENAKVIAVQLAENERRKTVSYGLIAGLVLTLLFSLILFNRFRLTRRQKAQIEAEKQKVDQAYRELNTANEKLKELDDFKSSFFTNISHEFRTPLTVIQGMVAQIMEKPDKWLVKGGEIIRRNTDGLLNLVNQILDLRKLESGGLSLDLQQGDVIKKLRLGVASFESMAEIKQIALSFESDCETLQMDFDENKLGQIQTNLLSNAIKFTPAGGKVRVEVKQQDDVLEMRVVDSGVGIPAEKLPFIFDRFYQVDSSSTREGEGTGIGLSLTRELVSLMRGTIEVKSQVGQGTTFLLRLPVTRTAPMASSENRGAKLTPVDLALPPAEQAFEEVVSGKELPSLLIIEDNPDIVEYLYACLDDQYELFSAPDGQAGIAAALEQVPDLIITDVMMPRKNGYEVVETLKLDERTSHIPIVMLTARADQESRLEGYQRGADAYLAKPFEPRELDIRLTQLFKLRQRLQQRYQNGQAPNEAAEDPQVQLEDAFITQVRTHILAHLDDGSYRGDALIKDLGMSRSNLHRKLKALTGLSTSHFIRQVRLEEAKELLQQPDLHAAEIAYATGFNDPNYFSRVFSEVVGMPPNEWRATHGSPD